MRPPPRMMSTGRPILYELDARSWLDRLSRVYARRIQLGNLRTRPSSRSSRRDDDTRAGHG